MSTNHLPPVLWEKTKWPEEELPQQEWWDVLPHKFSRFCILKAKILEISLLSEENFQKLRDFTLDDLYQAIFEDSYVIIEWLPRPDLPQELLNINRVELCVYDCGTFNTAYRVYQKNGIEYVLDEDGNPILDENEPLIEGFWNNPWMAFCEDDIVLIGYDPVTKGANWQHVSIYKRLILIGHSDYSGIDGSDNSFEIPAKCGAEAFLPVMPNQPTGKILISANGYIRLITLANVPNSFTAFYEFPNAAQYHYWFIDYRIGKKKRLRTICMIISPYPPNQQDEVDLYFSASSQLHTTCLRNSGSSNAFAEISTAIADQIHPGAEYIRWVGHTSEYQITFNNVPYFAQINPENNDIYWCVLSESGGGPLTNNSYPNYNRILKYTYNEQTNNYTAELYNSTHSGIANVNHVSEWEINTPGHRRYHVTHHITFNRPLTTVVFNGENSIKYQFNGTHTHDIGKDEYYHNENNNWIFDSIQWFGNGNHINTSGSIIINDQFGDYIIDLHSNIYRNVSHSQSNEVTGSQFPITYNINEKIAYFIEVDLNKCFYCWLEISANINGTIINQNDENTVKYYPINATIKVLYKGQETIISSHNFYIPIYKYCLAYIVEYGFDQYKNINQPCWYDYFIANDPDYVDTWWIAPATNNYTFNLHGQYLYPCFFEFILFMSDALWNLQANPNINLHRKSIFLTEGRGYISKGLFESDIGHIGILEIKPLPGGAYQKHLFYKGKYIGIFDPNNFGENNCGYMPIPQN